MSSTRFVSHSCTSRSIQPTARAPILTLCGNCPLACILWMVERHRPVIRQTAGSRSTFSPAVVSLVPSCYGASPAYSFSTRTLQVSRREVDLRARGSTEGVYVLHAFEKRTEQTAKHDIDVGKSRFRALVEFRTREGR